MTPTASATTKNVTWPVPAASGLKAARKLTILGKSTATTTNRYDPEFVGRLAAQLAVNPPIINVLWRSRGGGPLDVYFVVRDREKGYRAAAPVIRQLLEESALPLDFHFLEPDEVAEA